MSRMHFIPEKVSFACSLEVYQSLSLLQVCCCPASALHSSCFTQVALRKGTNPCECRVNPHHTRNSCQLRQANSFPSRTPFQQKRTCSETEQTASKEIKQLYNPSACPSLILSPPSELFEFPATVSYNHFFLGAGNKILNSSELRLYFLESLNNSSHNGAQFSFTPSATIRKQNINYNVNMPGRNTFVLLIVLTSHSWFVFQRGAW